MKGKKKLKGKWKRKGGCVYEAKNGDRIHYLGCILKAIDNQTYYIDMHHDFNLCMDIMGQNRKRALMLYCEVFNN